MEDCKIEKKLENIFDEIKNCKENKYDYNELSAQNLAEKKTSKENNGKNKLRSKFSYNEKNVEKDDCVDAKKLELIKHNYYSFNPKTENVFEFNGIEKSPEKSLKDQNIDLIFFKDKSSKKNDKDETISIAESLRVRSRKNLRINIAENERENFHSEKIMFHGEKYDFANMKEIIENKINCRNDHKKLQDINGDTNQVPSLLVSVGVDIKITNNYKENLTNIQNRKKLDSKSDLRCNTLRYEIPKNLEENFNNNIEPLYKNEAVTVRTKELLNKMDSNNFEMNGNEMIPRNSIRKVSKHESYYDFNNNIEINDKTNKANNQIPKINNEYIRNETSHQTVQSPKHTRNSLTHTNHNLGLDWTKDHDKKILVDLINENPTSKWDKIKIDSNIKIYKKKIENNPSILIKTIASVNDFTKEEIFNAIADVEIRKQWDTLFSEFKIVEENKEEKSEVLYMLLKSPFPLVERRDFVQRRKIWYDFPDKNSVCIHFKSVDHPDCPLHKKIVRAHTYISGYFIKTESINPLRCSVHIVSQTDVKGKIPTWIVNKASQSAPNDWVNNLIRGCKMIRDKKIL